MQSNAYFLAKFRFDTAENEPAKNLQNFTNLSNFAKPNPKQADVLVALELERDARGPVDRVGHRGARLLRGSYRLSTAPWAVHKV